MGSILNLGNDDIYLGILRIEYYFENRSNGKRYIKRTNWEIVRDIIYSNDCDEVSIKYDILNHYKYGQRDYNEE